MMNPADQMNALQQQVQDGQPSQEAGMILQALDNLSPEQLQALEDELEAQQQKELELKENLCKILTKNRDNAVRFRSSSGIELQWIEDTSYYEGEEDNRQSVWYKGMNNESPMIIRKTSPYRSKVFLNITRPYVETAASKVAEIVSPTDSRIWSLEPSLIPETPDVAGPIVFTPDMQFAQQAGQQMQQTADQAAQAAQQQPQTPGQLPMSDQSGLPPQQMTPPPDQGQGQMPPDMQGMGGQPNQGAAVQQAPEPENPFEKAKQAALKAAEGATIWIDDKLQQCDFTGQVRCVIDEAALLGTGVLRGPTPAVQRLIKVTQGQAAIIENIVPESRKVSVWNCYPDPACGDDIHAGQFFIEHDLMVEKQVMDLLGLEGYDQEAIKTVLEQGPMALATDILADQPNAPTDPVAKRFHVWYYYGFLTLEEAQSLNCACEDSDQVANAGVPVIVTMINDTPVRATLNQMIDGRFPYEFVCWQRVANSPFGVGIARQIRSCQSVLNASARAMMENAGLSSGPQIVVDRGSIMPADGKWEITPRKIWWKKADTGTDDVAQALVAVQIPSIQQELLATIDFALKMAENVTGLPVLLQGQQGPEGVPDTVGGMTILMQNASSLLRRMSRILDDSLIKPHIRSYYTYMMTYADDDSIKGDFKVVAHGSTSFITKDTRNIFLMNTVPTLMQNPAWGIDPSRLFVKLAEIAGIQDPESILFTKDEMAQQQQTQPLLQQQAAQFDPRVIVAQLNNQTKLQTSQMTNQANMYRIQRDTDRDTAYVQQEVMRTQVLAETRMAELKMRYELAMLEYANKKEISLDKLKAQLAIEGGRNDLARELATMPTVDDIVSGLKTNAASAAGANPATGGILTEQAGRLGSTDQRMPEQLNPEGEPPGRAPPGMGRVL